MYGDFSRDSFDPNKHYTRVLMQQGRPLTDADWNEQASILAQREWNLIRSLLRADHGTFDGGFFPQMVKEDKKSTLTICSGSYYVNGLRCVFCPTKSAVNLIEQVMKVVEANKERCKEAQQWLLYLDAWERTITAVEDQNLLEPSLSGNDTSLRTAVRWAIRLKCIPAPATSVGDKAKADKTAIAKAADATEPANSDVKTCSGLWDECDPTKWCVCPPESKQKSIRVRYRPTESQPNEVCSIATQGSGSAIEEALYRVEVHRAGKPHDLTNGKFPKSLDDLMTFKWSRENGASVVAIDETKPSSVVTIDPRWPNSHRPPTEKSIVELFDQVGRPVNAGRALTAVKTVNRNVLTVDPPLNVTAVDDSDLVLTEQPFADIGDIKKVEIQSLFLRRWDHSGTILPDPGAQTGDRDAILREQSRHGKLVLTADGAALAVTGKTDTGDAWLELEKGIQIFFPNVESFHEGDYWLIRTTAMSADKFWPPTASSTPEKWREVPRAGGHSYALLAKLGNEMTPISDENPCWIGRLIGDDKEKKCGLPPKPPAKPIPVGPAGPTKESVPAHVPVKEDGSRCALPHGNRESILSREGRVAMTRLTASPKDLTRRVPARYLNYEPQSDVYRRFRSPLLVSEILEASFEKYLAKVERCIDVSEAERALVEADARADYALAAEFQSLVSSGQGFRPLIA